MLKTKECKHGTFTYYTTDFWIGGALDAIGEYSGEEVNKLLSLLDSSSVVIEVGSNIGTITVPLANKAMVVYAYEPQPQTNELLKKNVEQNGLLDKCLVYSVALSSTSGHTSISKIDYDSEKINGGAASLTDDREGTFRVPMSTLDAEFSATSRVDLLKIDVEGHELAVLEGGQQLIQRTKPLIYVENDRPEKSVALIEKLFEMGYECYWHFPALYNPDPMIGDDSFISINMLCKHKDRIYPDHVTAGLFKVASVHDDWQFAHSKHRTLKEASEPRKHIKGNTWACIVRLGGLGDNLIASSVFRALKEKWGNLEVVCADPQHVIFENNPYIDKLTVKPQGDPPWQDGNAWQTYWMSRAREYSFFANLSHSCEVQLALTKAQTAYHWPASTRRRLCNKSYLEMVADICEVEYDKIAPSFFPTQQEWDSAAEVKRLVGGRYVGWVLTGSRLDKIWPPAGVVIGRIVKELGVPVVMFGAPGKDFEIAKAIQKYIVQVNGSDKDVHLALSVDPNRPNWPVRRVLTQTMMSDVVVTPDTGPAWAVAQMDMPKVVLLSHASKENITKYWKNTVSLHADPTRVPCWPCHLLIDEQSECERVSGKKIEVGAPCISDIAPDVVFENVKKALNMNTAPMLKAAE